jgi:molybdopterin converting factor small subunit
MYFIKRSLTQSEWQCIMRVTLLFRGPLAKKFKEGIIEVELDNNTNLLDLLSIVIEREGNVRDVWSSPEMIDCDALILCNGIDIGLSRGLDTKMTEGDVIMVLPLIHGG